jgi:uncharacterized protein with PCYCGC motif
MRSSSISRRDALARLIVVAAAPLVAGAARRSPRGPRHPEPRPGVTAEQVLADDKVDAEHKDAYAAAREIPEILDGIYCHCDCADRHSNLRSLLSCFETDMPMSCGICSGEARTALKLHRAGKSLDEIRAAIDKRFG